MQLKNDSIGSMDTASLLAVSSEFIERSVKTPESLAQG